MSKGMKVKQFCCTRSIKVKFAIFWGEIKVTSAYCN